MRLTLRTLLAYLNDTLEPTQAKEIGRKIDESDYAKSLTNRIREVVRKRRLLAPDMEGSPRGIDPNLIAEYLDNALAPDRVAEIEKLCLDNDVHLAEVAAADQIRTLAVCEPVNVTEDVASRMYRLNPGYTESAAYASVVSEPAAPVSQPAQADMPVIGSTRSRGRQRTERLEIPSAPLWQRMIPLALIVGLTTAWLWIMVGDPTLFLRPDSGAETASSAANEPAETKSGAMEIAANTNGTDAALQLGGQPVPDEMVNLNLQPEPARGGSGPLNEGAQKPENGPNDQAMAHIDAAPPADDPEVAAVGEENPAAAVVSAGDPNAAEADMANADMADAAQNPNANKPILPDNAAPPLMHQSQDQMLFVLDQDSGDWVRRENESIIESFQRFAVPEPFHGRFAPANTGVRVMMAGGTAVQYLPPAKDTVCGFYVDRGRLVLSRNAEANADQTVTVTISTRGQSYTVELMSLDTVVGIDLQPTSPTKFESPPAGGGYTGSVHVAAGSTKLLNSSGESVVVAQNDHQLLPFDRPEAPQTQVASVPEWVNSSAPQIANTASRYADTIKREVIVDISATDSMASLVSDRRPRVAELAALSLAMLEQYQPLVKVLWDSPDEETRAAAIDGLRSWLVKSPDNRVLLQNALGDFFSRDETDDIYRLLWGFDKEDGRDSQISRELVLWLDADHVAIRQLAFDNCQRLTGKTHQYRVNLSITQRARSLKSWMRFLDRQEGLLVP